MNHDKIINATNKIALYATVALIYWVFIFLISTAFDLRVFREHITEIFYLSLLGIFAILGGAVILNIMSNLSKISTMLSKSHDSTFLNEKLSRIKVIAFFLSFPLICVLLFGGNYLSAQKKKNMLIKSAQSLISENQVQLAKLADYQFSFEYASKAKKILEVICKIDKNFPHVTLILPDMIDDKKVFLGFSGDIYQELIKPIEKAKFIYSTARTDRQYLERVFAGEMKDIKFSFHEGHYELYYPIKIKGRILVLYLSDYQRYGKIGS